MIASELDVCEYRFDVIATVQVRTVRRDVKPGASFNLQK